MAISASLSYRTIFAMIPAIVLAFLVLKAAGVVDNGKQSLRQVLEAAGLSQISVRAEDLPGKGDTGPEPTTEASSPTFNLAQKIEEAVDSVEKKMTFARLGPIGLLLMAWSAITLLTTMERALNRILEAPRSRPLMVRVLLYWSAITFLPVVLLTTGYLATKATQLVSAHMPFAGVLVAADIVGNLLMGILVLACIYRFLPNTRVAFRAALIGAAVVVPVWIIARWGFSLYISHMVVKGSVYGALGLLPLFLIWVNLCWYAFLAGAEIAYTSANIRRLVAQEQAKGLPLGAMETLLAALAVGATYLARQRPATVADVATQMGLPEHAAAELLSRLSSGGIIGAVESDGEQDAYLPLRPLEAVRARDVLALGQMSDKGLAMDEQLADALRGVQAKTSEVVGEVTLGQLLRDAKGTA